MYENESVKLVRFFIEVSFYSPIFSILYSMKIKEQTSKLVAGCT